MIIRSVFGLLLQIYPSVVGSIFLVFCKALCDLVSWFFATRPRKTRSPVDPRVYLQPLLRHLLAKLLVARLLAI